jgi:hypothetical protein
VALVVGLAALLVHTAMTVAAVDALAGRTPDMRRAWRFALEPRVFGTLLLAGLAVVAAFVCCVVPLIYVLPLVSFTLVVMVQEGVFGAGALRRSATLAQHNPSRRMLSSPIVKVLAVYVVSYVLSGLVSLVFQLPLGVAQMVTTFRRLAHGQDLAMGGLLWLGVPVQIATTLLTTAVEIYIAFIMAMLYFDTRARREGIDLLPQLEAMAPESASAPPPPPQAPEAPANKTPEAPSDQTPQAPSDQRPQAPSDTTPEAPSNKTPEAPSDQTPEEPPA